MKIESTLDWKDNIKQMFYEDYNMHQDNINIHQIKEDSFQIDSPRMPSLREEI